MGAVKKLGEEVHRGLQEALPQLRKTILKKLPLAVGAMLEARTANTMELAACLPLSSERLDMRAQWLTRLLGNRWLSVESVLAPWARQVLSEACAQGQLIVLCMDQTDVGERFAVLMLSVRVGERALPLAWCVEAGEANIGWKRQRELLDGVKGWVPQGAQVMLLADRFYPSEKLFTWLHETGWHYRLRLKGSLTVDVERRDIETSGDLAAGATERYVKDARLFAAAVPTNIGVLHESGHDEPWIVAMNCPPTRSSVLDYGLRWGIEPMFSDFKSRGFGLEETQMQCPDRLNRLLLIMVLAMYWCVLTGRTDAKESPTPVEKKPQAKLRHGTGPCGKPTAAPCRGSRAD